MTVRRGRVRARIPRETVAKIATRVFNRKTETKYTAQFLTEPQDIYGSTFPSGGLVQLYTCLPDVTPGDDEWQRDGVKISPTRHTTDLDFTFNPRLVTANPAGQKVDTLAWDLTVHVWYGYARRFKSCVGVQANDTVLIGQHLEDGQGNNVQWTGAALDHMNQLNKEVMVLKHKKFRMFRPQGDQNTADGTQQTYFPQVIRKQITLGWKPPKTLLYNDGQNVPDNYAPFIIVGYQHNDFSPASYLVYNPSSPSVVNTPALQMAIKNHIWFKDA